MDAGTLGTQEFAWLIGSLCRIHRQPFNLKFIIQHCPAPHSQAQLVEAARSCGER